jgi:hypothetical protein
MGDVRLSIDTVWSDDKLGRREDANFLISYLVAKSQAVADVDAKGVSINLNSAWGSGKTFFLNRLEQQLILDGYKVANINAWRDDHSEEPLFAVISALLKALDLDKKSKKLVGAIKECAGKIALRTGKGLVSRAAGFFIGADNVEGMTDDITKALVGAVETGAGEYADRAITSFESGQMAIQEFRKLLQEAVGKLSKGPLFVLVDELDRCRPTYSVQLLERMKHLFDVPNVAFVVATDTNQLGHTIRAIYGSEFDSARYLHRFFDRTYEFDDPSILAFVKTLWTKFNLSEERFKSFPDLAPVGMIEAIAAETELSLRDLEQCLDILWTVEKTFRPDYPILLPYAFVLIAAYHKRCGFGVSDAWKKQVFSGPKTRITADVRDDWGRPTSPKLYSCREIFEHCHSQIIENGLYSRNASESRDPLAVFISRYRADEHQRLHGAIIKGTHIPSVISDLPSLIARAGKISV